jgi:hypothetical protein
VSSSQPASSGGNQKWRYSRERRKDCLSSLSFVLRLEKIKGKGKVEENEAEVQ